MPNGDVILSVSRVIQSVRPTHPCRSFPAPYILSFRLKIEKKILNTPSAVRRAASQPRKQAGGAKEAPLLSFLSCSLLSSHATTELTFLSHSLLSSAYPAPRLPLPLPSPHRLSIPFPLPFPSPLPFPASRCYQHSPSLSLSLRLFGAPLLSHFSPLAAIDTPPPSPSPSPSPSPPAFGSSSDSASLSLSVSVPLSLCLLHLPSIGIFSTHQGPPPPSPEDSLRQSLSLIASLPECVRLSTTRFPSRSRLFHDRATTVSPLEERPWLSFVTAAVIFCCGPI
ncbi:hypothetical protein ACLOJK_005996 [Asimina triloba]